MTRPNEGLTDEQVRRGRDDLEMLHRPHLWPHQGHHQGVHVKHRATDGDFSKLKTGVLFTHPEGHLVLMVLLPHKARIEFDNPEAVLAAGWIVD